MIMTISVKHLYCVMMVFVVMGVFLGLSVIVFVEFFVNLLNHCSLSEAEKTMATSCCELVISAK